MRSEPRSEPGIPRLAGGLEDAARRRRRRTMLPSETRSWLPVTPGRSIGASPGRAGLGSPTGHPTPPACRCGRPIQPPRRKWCSRRCCVDDGIRRRVGARMKPEPASCPECGGPMGPRTPRGGPRSACSRSCVLRAWRRRRAPEPRALAPCVGCGATIERRMVGGGRPQRWCSRPCRRRAVARSRSTLRRARSGAGGYTLLVIGVRDDWRCHLCRGEVDRALSGLDWEGPTIDHLIPLSRDGPDTPENVALAHRRCNVRRGARLLASPKIGETPDP